MKESCDNCSLVERLIEKTKIHNEKTKKNWARNLFFLPTNVEIAVVFFGIS